MLERLRRRRSVHVGVRRVVGEHLGLWGDRQLVPVISCHRQSILVLVVILAVGRVEELLVGVRLA